MISSFYLYVAGGHHPCDLLDHLVSAEMTAFPAEEVQAHMHVHRDQEPYKHHIADMFSHCATLFRNSHVTLTTAALWLILRATMSWKLTHDDEYLLPSHFVLFTIVTHY